MTGAEHQTRMSNHRFKPFLRPLKMKISTLTNLLYKMCVKQKTGRKHAHRRCTKNLCKYTLKKNIYIMFLFVLHTNTRIFSLHCCLILYTRIFSLHTAVSSYIHAFFLFVGVQILSSRYFVSKKIMIIIIIIIIIKTSIFCLNRPFSMQN